MLDLGTVHPHWKLIRRENMTLEQRLNEDKQNAKIERDAAIGDLKLILMVGVFGLIPWLLGISMIAFWALRLLASFVT